jgi:hypothetical protein
VFGFFFFNKYINILFLQWVTPLMSITTMCRRRTVDCEELPSDTYPKESSLVVRCPNGHSIVVGSGQAGPPTPREEEVLVTFGTATRAGFPPLPRRGTLTEGPCTVIAVERLDALPSDSSPAASGSLFRGPQVGKTFGKGAAASPAQFSNPSAFRTQVAAAAAAGTEAAEAAAEAAAAAAYAKALEGAAAAAR